MNTQVKKSLQYALFIGIGAVLLYLTFAKVNPVELWNNIRAVKLSGLLTIVAVGFLAMVFRGLRWVQLLHSLGYEVQKPRAIWAVAISYLINLVTPRVGEVARCTALNRSNGVPIDKLFGTVVLERVVDTIMFALVTLTTLIFSLDELGEFVSQSGANLPEFNALTIGMFAAALLLSTILLLSTKRIWMQWSFVQKIVGFLEGLYQGLRSLRTVENKPLFWAYSFGIWGAYVAVIAIGFKIFPGLEALGPEQAFFLSVAAGLGFLIPVPGGFGAYHYLVSKALMILGYSLEQGTAFATIIHSSQSLMFVFTGALGFVFLYFARRK